ncbi:unnamed protein product [Darwinula stevensoni]|uniref:Follistatin-like domain-containing protein n=1 Tax=Darwinula stevensoni TaxID=69355 RepID=A0A7R8XHV9_9CRUS|nr:unnamed protein product [Darwinula stevensoni]CAG0893828.1 unnamed protein product [Darwinula stevensoni]
MQHIRKRSGLLLRIWELHTDDVNLTSPCGIASSSPEERIKNKKKFSGKGKFESDNDSVDCPLGQDQVLVVPDCNDPDVPCVPTSSCIPSDVTRCEDVQCGEGSTCVMRKMACFAPPCYPVPFCVPTQQPLHLLPQTPEKAAGTCPMIDASECKMGVLKKCANDSDCNQGLLCCDDCGSRFCMFSESNTDGVKCHDDQVAVLVVPDCDDPSDPCIPTFSCLPSGMTKCEDVDCGEGTSCVMRKMTCFAPPCLPVPVCVPTRQPVNLAEASEREGGKCPELEGRQCSSDADCLQGLICCEECGRKFCVPPGVQLITSVVTSPSNIAASQIVFAESSSENAVCQDGQVAVLAFPECGDPDVCVPTIVCIPDALPTCLNVECEESSACLMREVTCDAFPCYPAPECVPTPKPFNLLSENPEGDANNDSVNCSLDQVAVLVVPDCDSPGVPCVPTSSCIPSDVTTCEDVQCGEGTTCVMREMACFARPCYPVPVCVPTQQPLHLLPQTPEKVAGTCPMIDASECKMGVLKKCANDSDCNQGLLCCDDCGSRFCMFSDSNNDGVNCSNGEVPILVVPDCDNPSIQDCIPTLSCLPSDGGKCPEFEGRQCSSDADCLQGLICCEECGRNFCVPPESSSENAVCQDGQVAVLAFPECGDPDVCVPTIVCIPDGRRGRRKGSSSLGLSAKGFRFPISFLRRFAYVPERESSSDYADCFDGQVAVLVFPECGDPDVCVPTIVCIPDDVPTCMDMSCGEWSACLMREVTCAASPCYPVAECVPLPETIGSLSRTSEFVAHLGKCPAIDGSQCHTEDMKSCTEDLDCDRGLVCCDLCGNRVCVSADGNGCPELGEYQCETNCSSDSDCGSGLLCCEDCGRKLCMLPELSCKNVHCLKDQECVMSFPHCGSHDDPCLPKLSCNAKGAPTCEDVRCGEGSTCVMREVTCVAAPCYPVPECVPLPKLRASPRNRY